MKGGRKHLVRAVRECVCTCVRLTRQGWWVWLWISSGWRATGTWNCSCCDGKRERRKEEIGWQMVRTRHTLYIEHEEGGCKIKQ